MLTILGAYRSLTVSLHQPVYGYANNYDMVRLQGCPQIWPDDPNFDPVNLSQSRLAPFTNYRHTVIDTPCYPSSELIFVYSALLTSPSWHQRQSIDIRHIGTTKALLLLAAVLCCSALLLRGRHWQALLINSALYAAVLSDLGVTLFFNTFFTEFSAVFFYYLTLWGVFFVIKSPQAAATLVLLLLGLCGLAFSKAQHLPLTCAVTVGVGLFLLYRQQANSLLCKLLLLPLLCCAISSQIHPSTANQDFYAVNRTNSLLNHASSQPGLIKQFLPAECEKLAGKTWYFARGEQVQKCLLAPDSASHLTILRAALADPLAVANNYLFRIYNVKNWQYNYLGQIGGADMQPVTPPTLSLLQLLKKMPHLLFVIAWLGFLLLPLLPKLSSELRGILLFCAFTQAASYFIALTGDGLSEIAKHSHLSTVSFLSILTIISCCLLWQVGIALKRR